MRMHVGHVAMRVTDLAKSIDHATRTLGLRVTSQSATEAYLSANEKHHELLLMASAVAGLDHVGLEIEDPTDLDAMRDRVIASGARVLTEKLTEAGILMGFKCIGPEGIVFELYSGMVRIPRTLETTIPALARKLGHVTFYAEEKAEVERFLLDVLGFRVSDRHGSLATWMRCDPDHHGIAVGQSIRGSGSRLHHYAFQMESIGEIAHYADHIARDGQHFLWGPGRHGPGFNIFTYLLDPEEAIVEVYSDLLRIDDEASYKAIDWSTYPHAMNMWGQDTPEGWSEIGVPILSPNR